MNYEALEAVKELFSIKPFENGNGWRGLMVPPHDNSVYDYGYPALSLELTIHPTVGQEAGLSAAFGCICSIDDSGVSIFGPAETQEKAQARLEKLKEALDQLSFHCPDKVALQAICLEVGMHPDYW